MTELYNLNFLPTSAPPRASRNTSTTFPKLKLNDGNFMPMLGFGTGTLWSKEHPDDPSGPQLVDVLKTALDKDYILIDTADAYGTEIEVGKAVNESRISRENIFLTTKVLKGWRDVPAALNASLERLGVDYVDLYLLHNPYEIGSLEGIQDAWKGMEAVKASGKARSIGVCNFQRHHLQSILEIAKEVPVINQLEYHPYLQRAHGFVPWMREQGIQVSSFNTLVPITVGRGGPLDEILLRIAKKYLVTLAEVLLSWAIGQGVIPIVTTSKSDRLDEYLDALYQSLSPEEQEEITRVGLKYHFRWWGQKYFDTEDRS